MDPLSFTTGCLSLLGSIGQTSLAITSFVRSCCEARGDLAEVARELSELKMVLELLQGDQDVEDDRIIPESLQRQILGILVKCNEVLVKIDAVLEKHRGRVGDIRWVATGENDVANLRQSLEAYRGALSLVLETITLALSRQVKADTNAIRADAVDIKQEISKIREDIERLRSFSTQAEELEFNASRELPNAVLQRYLDSLTSYAETVCEDIDYQNDPDIVRKEQATQDANTLSAGFRDLGLWQPEPSSPVRYTPQQNNTRGSTSQMAPQIESISKFTAASTGLHVEEETPPGSLHLGQQPNDQIWSSLREPTKLTPINKTNFVSICEMAISPSNNFLAALHANGSVTLWKANPFGSNFGTARCVRCIVTFSVRKLLVLSDEQVYVMRVPFAGSDSLLYVNVNRRVSGKDLRFLELWNRNSKRRIDYKYVGSTTAQKESTSGVFITSFCGDERRLSLYMQAKDIDRLMFLGSTENLYGVTRYPYTAISFFHDGDENGLVVATSNVTPNTYEEGKFPQLIIIEKIGGKVQAIGILELRLSRATPTGVASDKNSVWSLWYADRSWYIATWIIASSKVEVIELAEFWGYRLILSPNGRYIAAYHIENLDPRSHLAMLDGKTGRKLALNSWGSASLTSGYRIAAVHFSYDGRKLVVAHSGGKFQLFHRR